MIDLTPVNGYKHEAQARTRISVPAYRKVVTGMKSISKAPGRTPHMNTGTTAAGTRRQKSNVGHAALSAHEKEVLGWSRERRLKEFQKVNEGLDKQLLESKLMYIDSMTLDNGEILDALRTNPKLTWEMVKDTFLGGPVDGYTSTLHGLGDISYPEHFWKATIENEREKLITSWG
jgi:hypothetical protein